MGTSHTPQSRNYRTRVAPVLHGVETLGQNTVELSYQFVNHLHRSVTVLTRTGMRIIIPYRPMGRLTKPAKKNSAPLMLEPCFIVRVKLVTAPDVILDVSELSNDLGHATSVESKAYLEAAHAVEDKISRTSQNVQWVEYSIPQSDFDSEGGILFLQNLDLSLSVLDQASTPAHPFSLLGQRNRDAHKFKQEMAPTGVFYGVYIRDKDGQFGKRFMNINGVVHGIDIINDESEARDGVYFITSKRSTSSFIPQRVLVEYHPLEEADEKLGLYLTYNDAFTFGNPNEVFKRECEERARALKLEEQEWKTEKLRLDNEAEVKREQYKRELMEYEHQLRKIDKLNGLIDAELALRDKNYRREMMILKEVLDAKGHERREAAEIIKLIPTVITTIATYVAAYKKIKSL